MAEWSIRAIQNLILEKKEWDKKNLYATDSEKCARGLYYALTGEKETSPDDPQSLRRMEVGSMIEYNQVKKLRKLGILIEAQRRIYDEEFNVSGRHDGIIINPEECTERAKELIERKKKIFDLQEELDKEDYGLVEQYRNKEISREELLSKKFEIITKKQDLYDEDWEANQELLIPDPNNSLMVIEIKSITEKGFEWRKNDGQPMEGHRKQAMFYLWKLMDLYPNIKSRVVYVDTSFQNILEFDISLDLDYLEDMKGYWTYINNCVKNKELPMLPPSIVENPMKRSYRWQVNYQADWCKYHIKCTGDPNWKTKAIQEVERLNGKK